ncbi:hypothetical protein DPEC_G00227790 [Dallia pectoralis]|uniref:Uncharacterized protein n=1 Tax=Dallia pectoralis TaxID=75939 RepID=A0ACC2G0Y5_DALPE|nr:hypothetical protein DPEC_G00227790 [Dallia pectoralis]
MMLLPMKQQRTTRNYFGPNCVGVLNQPRFSAQVVSHLGAGHEPLARSICNDVRASAKSRREPREDGSPIQSTAPRATSGPSPPPEIIEILSKRIRFPARHPSQVAGEACTLLSRVP